MGASHAICVLLLLAPAASLEIVCGLDHNCVFERGTTAMKCLGRNDYGQLGYGDTNNRGDNTNEMGANLPFVNVGSEFVVEAMSLGGWHSCAMSDDRAMKCFGSNADSQLGFDGATTTGDALPFLEFGVDFNVSKIAAGDSHTCVLSTEDELKCFGANSRGECGAGTNTTTISGPPSQISAIDIGTNFTPIDVQTFDSHVCALSLQDTVKCFGENAWSQLGYGDDTVARGTTPESMGDGLPIANLGSNFIVAAIATGGYHSCALSTTKTVKCWGWNAFGQCGTPHSMETGDDLPVLDFGAAFVPKQLALGSVHTCILSETATLICFGDNTYGELGIGNTTSVDTSSTLTGIDLGTDFVPRQVAAGAYHNCAVSTDDGIKCWGANWYGQLGLGHLNNMGDDANEMGYNLPFVDVCLGCTASPTATPTTTTPTTKQPTVSPSTASPTTKSPTTATPTTTAPSSTTSPTTTSPTTALPSSEPTTEPTTKRLSTLSPTTASPSAIMTASTAAQTTTTSTIWTSTVAETTATTSSPSSSSATQTTVIITACASALLVAVVCICAAALYYVRKNYVHVDRRLSENVADAQLEEEQQQARNEIGNDAEVRVPSGVVEYARENAHVEDTRGEDNLSLPAHESVLCVDARRRDNIELAMAEVRVVPPGVFVHARENAHIEDTRGEDNLSLPAHDSVLCEDEEGIAAQRQGRRQSQQQHDGDAATLQTAVPTSGATAGIDPSLGVYEMNLMVDL